MKSISESIVLESRDPEGEDRGDAASLWAFFECFDIVVNTWAVAGCFDVHWQGNTVKYAHWESVSNYLCELRKQATGELNSYTEASAQNYVMAVEEEMRGYALGLARSDRQIPWGETLLEAGLRELQVRQRVVETGELC